MRGKGTIAVSLGLLSGLVPGCGEKVAPPSVLGRADLSIHGIHMARLPGDGNLVICGHRSKDEKKHVPALLLLSSEGAELWSHEYPELSVHAFDWIDPTSDGGFVTVGSTADGTGEGSDLGVVWLDGRGTVIRERKYGGNGVDRPGSVMQTREGDLLVSGSTTSSGAGMSDAYVLRLSRVGEVIWSRTYGAGEWEGQYDDGARTLQTQDGSFVLVSSTDSDSLVPPGATVAVYLVRIDANGSKMWERTYGIHGGFDVGTSVEELEDGGFILAGTRQNTAANGVHLIRTDAKGNAVWETTVGDFSDMTGLVSMEKTPGGFLLGNRRSNNAARDGGTFAHLAKLDLSGRKVWALDFGGEGYNCIYAISCAPHGDCAVLCSGPDWSSYLVTLAGEGQGRPR